MSPFLHGENCVSMHAILEMKITCLKVINFTQLEFIKKHVMNRFIFDQRREDKMSGKRFQNEFFIKFVFGLSFNCKVFVDFFVLVGLLDRTEFSSLAAVLSFRKTSTSSTRLF